ncbi:MAG: hypothetical protein N2438_07630 [Limisphaera sp.]|nr:hypothetical protein [Limisphaera sp.]
MMCAVASLWLWPVTAGWGAIADDDTGIRVMGRVRNSLPPPPDRVFDSVVGFEGVSKGACWNLTAFYTKQQRISIHGGDGWKVFSLWLGPVRFAPSSNRVATGSVRHGCWPESGIPSETVIWLAYCSGRVLEERGFWGGLASHSGPVVGSALFCASVSSSS